MVRTLPTMRFSAVSTPGNDLCVCARMCVCARVRARVCVCVRVCSRTLGWSESSWQQSDSAPLSVGWESLTSRQQTAALLLGYEAADFERQDGDRGGTDSNQKPRL